ncbi:MULTISPECIES: VOC family protein [unclassified Actinomyces]|uniref:VOC family protein n=1 Tax=unclassified Actinomyces TaxID=2609248 RepID=UPI0013744DFB|nr:MULTISPECIES: VOC family protein [unclassified Actinomyces]MBW3069763.1 VOC family protein [Actinomyces sp. 594]NDR54124.1 VOC family protein [Actinomyces sp. 565]QHO92059.1 VOC family protein [Actinomyces sp. 432]
MKADLSAYISFAGQARQALTYYREALGGELDIETFAAWEVPAEPGHEQDVLYGVLRTSDGFVLRATDRPLSEAPVQVGSAVALCLNGQERERLIACWKGLSRNAQVAEPLEETPWGDLNGVLVDPFGLRWIFNIGASE